MSDSERFLREHSAMIEANERLRAKLTEVEDAHETSIYQHREAYEAALQAQATIARVRELCDPQAGWDIQLGGIGFLDQRTVMRALNEDTK